MNILIILTSFNSLILVGFVVLLGGALYMENKKNKERLGIKNGNNKAYVSKTYNKKLSNK